MQFLVTALDGSDMQAPQRRLAAREEHLKGLKALKEAGNIVAAGPILSDDQQMIGSFMVCEFENREALSERLNNDVYSKTDVWQHISIDQVNIGLR